MKTKFAAVMVALVLFQLLATPVVNGHAAMPRPATAIQATYTPPPGSAERKAILDAYRAAWKKGGTIKDVTFVVNNLKVHNGWAWLDVKPQSSDGSQNYEGEQGLLRKKNGKWRVLDRTAGYDAKYFKKLKSKYPGVPSDIFPQG